MARTTKKELIGIIFNILVDHSDKEVCVAEYQDKLRNGRWGMHAYTLCAMNNVLDGWVLYVRPWAGAKMCWRANLERLKVAELQDIVGKCMMLTHS
jgi:hypothetical protein